MSIVTAHGRIYVVETPCGERWRQMERNVRDERGSMVVVCMSEAMRRTSFPRRSASLLSEAIDRSEVHAVLEYVQGVCVEALRAGTS